MPTTGCQAARRFWKSRGANASQSRSSRRTPGGMTATRGGPLTKR